MHLEEVRFFDLFGYSEEAGTWQCFMCNNPEKATGKRSAFVAGGLRVVGRGWSGTHRERCVSADGGRGWGKGRATLPA